MPDASFTVVLSALNEEGLIGEAIASVQAQTREDLELIVIDDGSSDGTAAVAQGLARKDERIRVIRQENRGLAASLNTGAAAGSAPVIALIDADDLWMPEFLERMGVVLESVPQAGFAFTDAWWFDMSSGRFFRRTPSEYMGAPEVAPSEPEALARSIMPGNWIFGLTAMRRAAFERVGGFSEHLRSSEDYELWLRMLAHGYAGVRAPGKLVVYRDRSGSMTKNTATMYESLAEVYRLAAAEHPFPEDIRALARERLSELERQVAQESEGRIWLGKLRRRLLPRTVWLREPPTEVARVFPAMSDRRPSG